MLNYKNQNIVGQKYNRLTIIAEAYRKDNRTFVTAKCDCGKIIDCQLYKIQSNHTQGCGCVKPKRRTHNLSKHDLYSVWQGIKRRCYEKQATNYHNYGGRGIQMCEDWKNNFEVFYNWAIKNNWQKGLQVDRRNNDQNYCPENCEVVTNYENAQNKRTTKFVVFDTILFTLSEAMTMELINRHKYYSNNVYRNSFKVFGDIA